MMEKSWDISWESDVATSWRLTVGLRRLWGYWSLLNG